ncbi:hypothetical protein DFH11DRAFT_1745572 [Phellopilus nigrolimitatus]|nr:hypothetical protein DFH11DRAFT_1745572 [Phellopilus nigrolimitatus]
MSATPVSAGTVSFRLLVGPLLAGVTVNAFVCGVCIMQLVHYVLAPRRDAWPLLALVAWAYAVDTFQSTSAVALLWHYVVSNFTRPAALASAPWEYASLPVSNALISLPIQLFLTRRIARLSGARLPAALLALLAAAQAALGCAAAARGLKTVSVAAGDAAAAHVAIVPLADAWLAASVASSAGIALALLYLLSQNRDTRRTESETLVNRLCRLTLESGALVAAVCPLTPPAPSQILDLVFLVHLPNNNLHYMFALPIGRLYTRAAPLTRTPATQTLNARAPPLSPPVENSFQGFHLTTIGGTKQSPGGGGGGTATQDVAVRLDADGSAGVPAYASAPSVASTLDEKAGARARYGGAY